MNHLHSIAICVAAGVATSASASIMHASGVANFDQGLRKNGTAVEAARSITANALGAPQLTDTVNSVSLGFGGELVLTFDTWFGESVSVWETTYGNASSYREAANVYVGVGGAWDTATYYHVGLLQNTADGVAMSLDPITQSFGVSAFNFLKIVDATNPSLHSGSADGFDVDGVMVHAVQVPAPGGAMLAAFVGLGALRRRRA